MLPAGGGIRTLALFDLNVGEGATPQIQFHLQFDRRLFRPVRSAAPREFRAFAVRQCNGRAVEQRDAREAFQQRCQGLGGSDHDLHALSKQLFQKLDQFGGAALIHGLWRDNGPRLHGDFGQIIQRRPGLPEMSQHKCHRERQRRELALPLDDVRLSRDFLRHRTKQPLKRRANLG